MTLTKNYENILDQERKLLSIISDVDIVHAEGTTPAGETIPVPVEEWIEGSKKPLKAVGNSAPAGFVDLVDEDDPSLTIRIDLGQKKPQGYSKTIKHPAWTQLENDGVITEGFIDTQPAIKSIETLKVEAGGKLVEWTGEKYAEGYTHTDGKRYWIEERDMLQFTMAESGMNAVEKAGLTQDDQAFKGMDGWTAYAWSDAWTFIALYYQYVQSIVRDQMLVNDQIANADTLADLNSALAIIGKSI